MDLVGLVLVTLAVTPSGALSPGPLTTATIALGVKGGWRAGVKVAFGHSIVEFFYIMALYMAFEQIHVLLEGVIGSLLITVAISIIACFALLLLRDAVKGVSIQEVGFRVIGNPLLIGIMFTGLNVFFLIWWISIGFKLIIDAISLGIIGVIVMYVSHVWMDYAWLTLIAEAGARAKSILGSRGYRILLGILGTLLILFAANMATSRFLGFNILPF